MLACNWGPDVCIKSVLSEHLKLNRSPGKIRLRLIGYISTSERLSVAPGKLYTG